MSCSSTQNIRFQLRRATEAQWAATNPQLLPGEPAISTDTKQIKIGNGGLWSQTDYINLAGGVGPIGTPTTLQSLLTISTATSKNLTVINLSAPITLSQNQAVVFPSNITASGGSGGNIVAGTIYYVWATVSGLNSIQVKTSIPAASPY